MAVAGEGGDGDSDDEGGGCPPPRVLLVEEFVAVETFLYKDMQSKHYARAFDIERQRKKTENRLAWLNLPRLIILNCQHNQSHHHAPPVLSFYSTVHTTVVPLSCVDNESKMTAVIQRRPQAQRPVPCSAKSFVSMHED